MTSHVYFLAAPQLGRVKIGVSSHVDRRIRALKQSSGCALELLGMIVGSRSLERAWHQRLASKRVIGEWFALDDEVRTAIRQACSSGCLDNAFDSETTGLLDRLRVQRIEQALLAEDVKDTLFELKRFGVSASDAEDLSRPEPVTPLPSFYSLTGAAH